MVGFDNVLPISTVLQEVEGNELCKASFIKLLGNSSWNDPKEVPDFVLQLVGVAQQTHVPLAFALLSSGNSHATF